MNRWVAAAISFFFAAGLLAQDDKKKNDFTDKDNGFYIAKPPKNDAWDVKTDTKKLNNSLVSVAHRIDDIAVEVFFQKQNKQQPLNLDPKESAKNEIKGQEEGKTKGDYKEVKVKESAKEVNFPGDGGAKAQYFTLVIKDKNDKEFEWHEYIFLSKANGGQYRVFILCAPGELEKKKKEVDVILGSFKSFKLPK